MDWIADADPLETGEWLQALDSVLAFEGPERAGYLLGELVGEARRQGTAVPYSATTPYLNTIPPERQAPHPGDRAQDPFADPLERARHRAARQQE